MNPKDTYTRFRDFMENWLDERRARLNTLNQRKNVLDSLYDEFSVMGAETTTLDLVNRMTSTVTAEIRREEKNISDAEAAIEYIDELLKDENAVSDAVKYASSVDNRNELKEAAEDGLGRVIDAYRPYAGFMKEGLRKGGKAFSNVLKRRKSDD